jgi:hypothetical protein
MYVLFTNTRLNFKDISGIYNTGSYIVSQAVEKINCESGVDKELRDFIKTTEKELGLV